MVGTARVKGQTARDENIWRFRWGTSPRGNSHGMLTAYGWYADHRVSSEFPRGPENSPAWPIFAGPLKTICLLGTNSALLNGLCDRGIRSPDLRDKSSNASLAVDFMFGTLKLARSEAYQWRSSATPHVRSFPSQILPTWFRLSFGFFLILVFLSFATELIVLYGHSEKLGALLPIRASRVSPHDGGAIAGVV